MIKLTFQIENNNEDGYGNGELYITDFEFNLFIEFLKQCLLFEDNDLQEIK